jgi:hypothetical protein
MSDLIEKPILELHCFKFLLVQRTAFNFRFLWLKNKEEINLFENLHSFKGVEVEASD